MAISLVGVGDKITAALMNKLISAVNVTALAGVVPISVSGSGVSVSANGAVTFANATTINIDGVFSGSYDNYRITWNSPTRSTSGSIQFQLRGAGSNAVSGYDFTKGYDAGTARTISSSSSGGAVPLDQGVAAAQLSSGVLDLFSPAMAQNTSGTSQSMVLANSAPYSVQVSIAHESPVAYDGFSLYLLGGTGTWSGTVRVYGYNNLI